VRVIVSLMALLLLIQLCGPRRIIMQMRYQTCFNKTQQHILLAAHGSVL
jgi:hypothetical protein